MGCLIADVQGLSLSERDKRFLDKPWLGGLILFSRNYQDPEQLQQLICQIRATRPELLIAVDQEGGRVQRLKSGLTLIPPMQVLGNHFQLEGLSAEPVVRDIGWLLASELLAFDIDISFAPVLDVDDYVSKVIGDRSFGADPQLVTNTADVFIQGMHAAGMAVTAKHFPGHGAVKADSHLELPVDKRDFEQIAVRDLKPFTALMPRLDAVMTGHILFPSQDKDIVTFSSYWLKQILRQQLQFSGVVFSDDLSMQGAAIESDVGARAIRAIEAGCDAILVCNNREAAERALAALQQRYGNAHDQPLAAMRGRRQLAWEELQSHPRYLAAKESIVNLNHKS